jgi:hypothetical protein
MAQMIARVLGKKGFTHSPNAADLECLFARERLNAPPLNTG